MSIFKDWNIEKIQLDEVWREYDFNGRIYRIDNPRWLQIKWVSMHSVIDSKGVVHCVPAPGYCGCVVRSKSGDSNGSKNL